MESVLSAAYCVIAASRGDGMDSGFLKPRPQERGYAMIPAVAGSDEPVFICQSIDDFDKDVIQEPLSTRGLVYQERALARRTIFFTEKQMYFECGMGVFCETMTRMQNPKTSFLGDPNFPAIILDAKPGAKIANFQELYKTYSGLQLSYTTDRPFAIKSLEYRLLRALGARGGMGIIEDDWGGLLRRSLLWIRGQYDKSGGGGTAAAPTNCMVRIPGVKLPSWSWMAYTGRIDYLTPPSGETEWGGLRMEPALPAPASEARDRERVIIAPVRDVLPRYALAAVGSAGEPNLVFDAVQRQPSSDGNRGLQCVVMGVSRRDRRDRTHYVLLVKQLPGSTNVVDGRYVRVGAGSLPESMVGPVGEGPDARIY